MTKFSYDWFLRDTEESRVHRTARYIEQMMVDSDVERSVSSPDYPAIQCYDLKDDALIWIKAHKMLVMDFVKAFPERVNSAARSLILT